VSYWVFVVHFPSISPPTNSTFATPFLCCTRRRPKGFPNQFDLPGVRGKMVKKKLGERGSFRSAAVRNQYAILLPIVSRFLISFAFVIFHGRPLGPFFPIPLVLTPFFSCFFVDFVCCRDFIAWSCFVCLSGIPIPISIRPAKSHLTWHFNDVDRSGIPIVSS